MNTTHHDRDTTAPELGSDLVSVRSGSGRHGDAHQIDVVLIVDVMNALIDDGDLDFGWCDGCEGEELKRGQQIRPPHPERSLEEIGGHGPVEQPVSSLRYPREDEPGFETPVHGISGN
jgi:hypothetical protein